MCPNPERITQLLRDWQSGREEAFHELMPLVYDQLRAIAARQLTAEQPGNTLRATELVHEAYLRLVGADISFADRAHFYAVSARLIRRILIDHARKRQRDKRGGGATRISLEEDLLITPDSADTVLAIHEALERLEALDPRKARIVELVFFGGLEQDLAAVALHISPATLRRDLRLARAWLYNELRQLEKGSDTQPVGTPSKRC
jgi:RNA polymerase sigma-70 factor (ECF subfamily)